MPGDESNTALLSVEVDVAWRPAEDYVVRYTSALDSLSRLVEAAGVLRATYSCTSRPERGLTTVLLEGRVAVERVHPRPRLVASS